MWASHLWDPCLSDITQSTSLCNPFGKYSSNYRSGIWTDNRYNSAYNIGFIGCCPTLVRLFTRSGSTWTYRWSYRKKQNQILRALPFINPQKAWITILLYWACYATNPIIEHIHISKYLQYKSMYISICTVIFEDLFMYMNGLDQPCNLQKGGIFIQVIFGSMTGGTCGIVSIVDYLSGISVYDSNTSLMLLLFPYVLFFFFFRSFISFLSTLW